MVTDCVQRCVANTTGTGLPLEMPTGTGFNSAQAGLTWLYASDPAVFFGGVSYLHNFPRDNLSRTLLLGERRNSSAKSRPATSSASTWAWACR